MLRLALLRHAKAAPEQPGGDDFSRPLHERGESEAPMVRYWLRQRKIRFDLALCSPAKRTTMTADIVLPGVAGKRIELQTLYHCSINDILAALMVNAAEAESVVIVGHNPVMADMAHWLVGHGDMEQRARLVGGYPPGSIMIADLPVDTWKDVRQGCGTLVHFVRPKDIAQGS
ncbi:MAG: histidine phosphatase family protein [Alphaproteobacteria bacterium]|nr:histidine phosphatase family protein [Alphaproteobacteria bacterium]